MFLWESIPRVDAMGLGSVCITGGKLIPTFTILSRKFPSLFYELVSFSCKPTLSAGSSDVRFIVYCQRIRSVFKARTSLSYGHAFCRGSSEFCCRCLASSGKTTLPPSRRLQRDRQRRGYSDRSR